MSGIVRRKSLDVWIREAITDQDKDDQITALSLVHMVNGEPGKEIHTFKFAPGKGQEPKDLADMFMGKARSFAQDLPGVQTFCLLAFYGSKEPGAYQPFIVSGQLDNHGIGSETPDERGMRAQQMRHSDAFFAQLFRRQEQLDIAMGRTIELQNRMVETLGASLVQVQHDNIEAFEVVKNLLIEKESKAHENETQRLEYERKTREREQYLKMIPMLVNSLSGREIFPQGAQDTALVEMIADKLDEDQIMKLAQVLPPEVTGLIMQRFEKAIEKKMAEKRMKMLEQTANSRANPELDAAGEPQ